MNERQAKFYDLDTLEGRSAARRMSVIENKIVALQNDLTMELKARRMVRDKRYAARIAAQRMEPRE